MELTERLRKLATKIEEVEGKVQATKNSLDDVAWEKVETLLDFAVSSMEKAVDSALWVEENIFG